MKDEALRLALDFVEDVYLGEWRGPTERQEEVITAIKKALAQPEWEPVALLRSLGPKPWETSESAHAQMKLILDFEKAYKPPPVATNDTSQDRVDETAKQRHEPEPVAWVDLLKEAQKIVESKPLWKRFIAGTPLANDIACWMADFAQLVAQKCAEIADTAEPYQSADLIRKHFGVEK